MNNKKTITITWGTDDIISRANDRGYSHEISEIDAARILQNIKDKHDCNVGINWDVIDIFTDIYVDEKQSFINRHDLYRHNEPDKHSETRSRLVEIFDAGMIEVGTAQFGIKDIVSGLYIEMVWNFSDKDFKNYMEWAKRLIASKEPQLPKIKFYKTNPENWNDIEILPVFMGIDGICDVVNEGMENMWCVYVHLKEGGLLCIADLPTKELAEQMYDMLESILPHHKI